MQLDFSRCRDVWVPDDSEAGGFWSPPPAHVRLGVRTIVDNPFFLLADDMGGMKTAQAIITAQFLHDTDSIDRVIVLTPATIRSKVWFDKDLGQLHEQVFHDKRNRVSEYHQKIKSWVHGPEDAKELRWIVSNYEYVRNPANLAVLLPYCGPKTLLILDESSAVRGDSAQTEAAMLLRWKQSKRGRPVPGVARCGRILLLNGTPVAESPLDMFTQGNLMHPSILECKYKSTYKARYAIQTPVLERGKPMMRYGKPVLTIAPGAESWTNLADLQQRFAPYILRREAKEFGVDFALPPVGFDVPLTEATWRMYRKMRDEMVVWLKSGVATAHQAGTRVIRLAQITSGFLGGIEDPGIGEEFGDELFGLDQPPAAKPDAIQVIGSEKLDFALALQRQWLAHDPNLKLLTWCRFVFELKRYLTEVRKLGHPVGVACGSALFDTSMKRERETAMRLLHPKTAPAGPVTVGGTQGTGALGHNFTVCHTVLDLSYDESPWKKQQGDARVNRTGQTRPVSFFYLVATGPKGQKTWDHHVMMTRLGKTNINDWTVSAWVSALEEE